MSSRAVRGPFRFNWTKTVTTGNYTVVNESIVFVNKGVGAPTTITLPPSLATTSPSGRRCVVVVDGKGDANTNNITVAASGSDTVNGGASFVMQSAYAVALFWDLGGGVWTTNPGEAGGNQTFTNVTLTGLLTESFADALTAAGTTQAAALALTKEVNRVTTAAATSPTYNGVKLPAAAPGLTILVINSAANPVQVYGAGTDTINDVATATGITQMQNSIYIYACTVAGKWYCEGAGAGFAGSLATIYSATGITAHSGGGQGSATTLVAGFNRVTTVAAQGDSVALPAAVVGLWVTLDNRGANAMQVYGAGTDTINGIATATGISHGVNQIATYYCAVAGNWEVQFSQPQQAGIVTLSGAADAIPPHVAHTYVVTKAGVDAMTLAAPTATTDDGLIITITSNTANAHTLTATGLLQTGSASVNVATFAAQKGAGLTLMAYQGKWNVLCSVGITFS